MFTLRTLLKTLPAFALVVFQVILVPAAMAASGDLDPTFGIGGKVATDVGEYDEALGLAIQSDGKVIAIGGTYNTVTDDADLVVARYRADGTLDPSFGIGGVVTTDFGGKDGGYAVSLRSGGKILVAGETTPVGGDSEQFIIARYNPDGTMDTSFGTGGKVTSPFGGDRITRMIIEKDGSIDVTGVLFVGPTDADFVVGRYGPEGAPDASFGSGGTVITDFGAWDFAGAIAVQPNGEIIAGGTTGSVDNDDDFALARYNTDGTLDPTFGVAGKVTTDFSSFDDEISDLVLETDGKILAVGTTVPTAAITRDFALAQYASNGTLDPAFGTGGKVRTDFGGNYDVANAGLIQPDGMIVAAGFTGVNGTAPLRFALARYGAAGTLDPSFGSSGRVTTDFPGRDDGLYGLALQSDGKIIAAGVTSTGTDGDFALARYQGAQPVVLTPSISTFAPRSGPVGTAVTITGTNLAGASTVMFNNVVQPYFSVDASGTYLTTTVPAGATSGPIWVMTPYGTGSSVDSFIVTASRHLRGLTFSLWGHLVAGGYLTTTDAFPGCYQDATVKIQRHGRWRWNTVVTALTDANGRYHLHVWDRAGRYRAKVTEVILGSGDVCAGAISPVRWHHHG